MEGILRQAADVDEVERRVREYEQGLCFFFFLFMANLLTTYSHMFSH